MFLPWVGLFAQIELADVFVHYDDVQLPQGRSFISRVQILGDNGPQWLTAPLDRVRSGKLISETQTQSSGDWRKQHLTALRRSLSQRRYSSIAMALAEEIYDTPDNNLAAFNIQAIERISQALGQKTTFVRSSDLGIGGRSSARLIGICKAFQATRYVTGHGALNYLDHDAFESEGVAVDYMDYSPHPWPQGCDAFTPYVTSLDLFAAVSESEAASHLNPQTTPWRSIMAAQPSKQ